MIEINMVYTKTGDDGSTSLAVDGRVSKASARIEAIGTVDELNSQLGVVIAHWQNSGVTTTPLAALARIQNDLFNLGSELALCSEAEEPKTPCIRTNDTTQLEQEIDHYNASLPALTSFVLPGGSLLSAQLQVARSVCRRAERRLIQLAANETVRPAALIYLNRCSDWLFVLARWVLTEQGQPEYLWQPQ